MIVGIIGCGNMGTAILSTIRNKFKVRVAESDKNRCRLIKRKYKTTIKNIPQLVRQSDVIIVAVKPQNIGDVLDVVRENITKSKLVISIAAGVTIHFLQKKLGHPTRVIRTMPNLPAQIGEGITAIAKGRYAKKRDVDLACRIFSCMGETVVVKENLIDAITAVSGSGPAYVFHFIENFAQAAQALGLNKALSQKLVKQTLLGSSHLFAQRQEEAAILRAKVTSKGGTTQAALNVFSKNKIGQIYKKALHAAQKRAKELSKK